MWWCWSLILLKMICKKEIKWKNDENNSINLKKRKIRIFIFLFVYYCCVLTLEMWVKIRSCFMLMFVAKPVVLYTAVLIFHNFQAENIIYVLFLSMRIFYIKIYAVCASNKWHSKWKTWKPNLHRCPSHIWYFRVFCGSTLYRSIFIYAHTHDLIHRGCH